MTGYDDMMNHPPSNHNSVGGPVGGLGPPGMNPRGGKRDERVKCNLRTLLFENSAQLSKLRYCIVFVPK